MDMTLVKKNLKNTLRMEKDINMSNIVIGIVSKHKKSNDSRTDSLIRDEVKQAIFDNGALAIGILSTDDEIMFSSDNFMEYDEKINKSVIIEQIKLCDGIILQGGSESEAYEPFIAKYCYDNDIPCLGICAGQNNIARGLGGTIKCVNNPDFHNRPNDQYVHNINIIDKNSKIFNIIKKDNIRVNSRHKNVLDSYPLLKVTAVDEDGYPDVVESEIKHFYIGIRFHPESLYKIDENHNNIFKAFIGACDERKNYKK